VPNTGLEGLEQQNLSENLMFVNCLLLLHRNASWKEEASMAILALRDGLLGWRVAGRQGEFP